MPDQPLHLTDPDRRLAALAACEARYLALAEQPFVGVFRVRDGALIYASTRCAAIFGRSTEEMQSGDPLSLLHPDSRPVAAELMRAHLAGERADELVHVTCVRPSGEEVELALYGVRDPLTEDPVFTGVVQDITQHRQAERVLQEREEQLRHAQKLESVGRLAGGIAHDFNNLLMVIQGSAKLVLMDPGVGSSREDLEEILRAAERGARLTRQLLAFSRKQVLRTRLINLNALVDDLLGMIGRVIGSDISLEMRLDPELGSIEADPGQLEQVIMNLVLNACDAMPGGGTLRIETRNATISRRTAKSFEYSVQPGRYVHLVVQDSGSGMDESVLARAFDPYFTTKDPGKGTGLGLAVVYGVVKQSGGYLWARSEPGEGTTIEIYLPQADEAEAQHPGRQTEEREPRHATVLLVENEESVRVVTRRTLERAGHRVLEATGAEEARIHFQRFGTTVAALVTGVEIPDGGGKALAAVLREWNPTLPVIYLSEGPDPEIEPAERDHLLTKPFTVEALLETVQHALTR